MPDYTDAFNNIKTEIANLVKAVTDGKKSQKAALDEIAKKIEKLKAAAGIEDSVEFVDLGLPSGPGLWAYAPSRRTAVTFAHPLYLCYLFAYLFLFRQTLISP